MSTDLILPALLVYVYIIHFKTVIFTIYLHRCLAHKSITIKSKGLIKFFNFYYWMIWGQFCSAGWEKAYVAKHRKHHAYSDTKQDPHSPHFFTNKEMMSFQRAHIPGGCYYISPEDLEKYASDVENSSPDWVQKNIYRRFPYLGRIIFGAIFTYYFGIYGFIIAVANIFCMTAVSAFLTNISLHKYHFNIPFITYTNASTRDRSSNILPFAWFLAGEELHSNHHHTPTKTSFAHKWWEIDFGMMYAWIFKKLKLIDY